MITTMVFCSVFTELGKQSMSLLIKQLAPDVLASSKQTESPSILLIVCYIAHFLSISDGVRFYWCSYKHFKDHSQGDIYSLEWI